ncbi:hypothetical protein GGG16DRAFT_113413 [Schizophyllum commune]
MSSTVYLVSGASRGLGLEVVTQLATRPDAIVFAGARDPARATGLQALAKAHPGRLHVVKLTSAEKEDNIAAVEKVKRVAGRLDVVIANAGIGDTLGTALEVNPEDMVRHFEVNTNGALVLFQAAYPLLKESKTPKFVAITSQVGSIVLAGEIPLMMYPYGASKAALNWVMRKLHHDFPGFGDHFPLIPGTVATDGARAVFERSPGMKEAHEAAIIPAEESARGMLKQIDVATRETHGGQLVDYSGIGNWQW